MSKMQKSTDKTEEAGRIAQSAHIGLLVPPMEGAVPADAAVVYPELSFKAHGLGLQEMTPEGYDSVLEEVGRGAARLAEQGASVVALMGTSLSFYRGLAFNAELEREIELRSGLPGLTMSTAIIAACHAVGAQRLAVATAYTGVVNERLLAFLAQNGMEVVSLVALDILSIDAVHRVPDGEVTRVGREAFAQADRPDAILISCGGLTTRPAVKILEADTGVPVITSPLAGLWATVAKGGQDPRVADEGYLFQQRFPTT
ncbi:arylmalonate decarboxylase [Nitratireductor rhodophyticola]|uniref:arylmalonate decarboxylase n=1 Tax=Nitratireductor rhodophyticola TaxID=2854036 RepID=UPI00300A67C9